MQSTFIPAIVKDGHFEGSVTVNELTFDERYDLADEIEAGKLSGVKTIRLVLAKHASKVVKVDVKHKTDGRHFTDWASLEHGHEAHSVRRDVALYLLGGQARVDVNVEKKAEKTAAPAEGNSPA